MTMRLPRGYVNGLTYERDGVIVKTYSHYLNMRDIRHLILYGGWER